MSEQNTNEPSSRLKFRIKTDDKEYGEGRLDSVEAKEGEYGPLVHLMFSVVGVFGNPGEKTVVVKDVIDPIREDDGKFNSLTCIYMNLDLFKEADLESGNCDEKMLDQWYQQLTEQVGKDFRFKVFKVKRTIDEMKGISKSGLVKKKKAKRKDQKQYVSQMIDPKTINLKN